MKSLVPFFCRRGMRTADQPGTTKEKGGETIKRRGPRRGGDGIELEGNKNRHLRNEIAK